MQKKIIALAVAGLVSGVAFAQSNVTVYGVADAAYTYSNGKGYGFANDLKTPVNDGSGNLVNFKRKFSGIQSGGLSGSRIGFKGEEALGNGLKAVFTLEYKIGTDTGSGIGEARQSFVGLSGNFGSVTLGKQYAPSFMYMGKTNANGIVSVAPGNLIIGDFFSTLTTGDGSRWSNSVVYQSPVWSGFNFRTIYSFGEKTGQEYNATNPQRFKGHDTTDAGKFGIGGAYENGPVYLTAVYQYSANDKAGDGKAADWKSYGEKAWLIGGAYDLKVVKLFANFAREKGNEDGAEKRTMWSLGVGAPIGSAGNLSFEYSQFKDRDAGDDENKTKGFGIVYTHDLSKRTTLYGGVSHIKNQENVAYGATNQVKNGAGFGTGTVGYDGKVSTVQMGIRHSF